MQYNIYFNISQVQRIKITVVLTWKAFCYILFSQNPVITSIIESICHLWNVEWTFKLIQYIEVLNWCRFVSLQPSICTRYINVLQILIFLNFLGLPWPRRSKHCLVSIGHCRLTSSPRLTLYPPPHPQGTNNYQHFYLHTHNQHISSKIGPNWVIQCRLTLQAMHKSNKASQIQETLAVYSHLSLMYHCWHHLKNSLIKVNTITAKYLTVKKININKVIKAHTHSTMEQKLTRIQNKNTEK